MSSSCFTSKILVILCVPGVNAIPCTKTNTVLVPNLALKQKLVELTSEISSTLRRGLEVDACLLDFSKGFNKVNHHKLVTKMRHIGANQQLLSWTNAFLSDT